MWPDVLAEAGVAVARVDADHVELSLASGQWTLPRTTPGPRPTALQDHEAAHSRRTAGRPADHSCGARRRHSRRLVRRNRRRHRRRVADGARPRSSSARRGPDPWGMLTVVRRLLEKAPITQRELSRMSGINQSRVSQVLKPLTGGLVMRTAGGWQPADWDRLCDWWLDSYRSPGGVVTHWY